MTDDILVTREISPEEQEELDHKIFESDPVKFKFYEDLRQKAKGWTKEKTGKLGGKLGEYLFLLPDFFILLGRLMIDKRVPAKQKAYVGGIIAYVILPFDIIPDFIPVIGYLDDLVLVVMGLNMILNEIDSAIIIDNWSGEGDVLKQMQGIVAAAEAFLDRRVLRRIKRWLRRF